MDRGFKPLNHISGGVMELVTKALTQYPLYQVLPEKVTLETAVSKPRLNILLDDKTSQEVLTFTRDDSNVKASYASGVLYVRQTVTYDHKYSFVGSIKVNLPCSEHVAEVPADLMYVSTVDYLNLVGWLDWPEGGGYGSRPREFLVTRTEYEVIQKRKRGEAV